MYLQYKLVSCKYTGCVNPERSRLAGNIPPHFTFYIFAHLSSCTAAATGSLLLPYYHRQLCLLEATPTDDTGGTGKRRLLRDPDRGGTKENRRGL